MSQEAVIDKKLDEMCSKFIQRGYPPDLVQEYHATAREIDRNIILRKSKKKRKRTGSNEFLL